MRQEIEKMLLKLARLRHEYGNNEDYAKFMTPFICSLIVERLKGLVDEVEFNGYREIKFEEIDNLIEELGE